MTSIQGRWRILGFTGSRAEYYLQRPLFLALEQSNDFDFSLIVGGAISSESDQKTIDDINNDGYSSFELMSPLPVEGSSNHAELIATIVPEVCSLIRRFQPDLALCYADRYETFAFAVAAFHSDLVVVHLEAGDITTGGTYDDQIRHCISQMSHLLFSSTPGGLQHIRKLIPQSWRSCHSGLLRQPVISIHSDEYVSELCRTLTISETKPLLLITVHPIPRDPGAGPKIIEEIFEALKILESSEIDVIITSPNADSGFDQIQSKISSCLRFNPRIIYVETLGGERYNALLSMAVSRTVIVAGNSSSVIKEAPFYSAYGLNIGTRQTGRESADTQFDVHASRDEISRALTQMLKKPCQTQYNPYFNDDPVAIVINFLKEILSSRSLAEIKTITY